MDFWVQGEKRKDYIHQQQKEFIEPLKFREAVTPYQFAYSISLHL